MKFGRKFGCPAQRGLPTLDADSSPSDVLQNGKFPQPESPGASGWPMRRSSLCGTNRGRHSKAWWFRQSGGVVGDRAFSGSDSRRRRRRPHPACQERLVRKHRRLTGRGPGVPRRWNIVVLERGRAPRALCARTFRAACFAASPSVTAAHVARFSEKTLQPSRGGRCSPLGPRGSRWQSPGRRSGRVRRAGVCVSRNGIRIRPSRVRTSERETAQL